MDGRFVAELDGTGIDRDEAGAKAWALDRLVEHGFRVPPAVVVLAGAYRAATATPVMARLVQDLEESSIPDHGGIAEAEAAIEERFLAAPLPEELVVALDQAVVRRLHQAPLAVRSSVTLPTGSHHSCEGQYRSYMGITDREEALRAIRRCWASLWFPSARQHRVVSGISTDGLGMAVIVQPQVPADWSGVMLTRDPQGDGSTLRIDTVPGPGEDFLAGRIAASDHRVDRGTLAVSGSRLEAPAFLEDLARLGLRIERRFGEPQDIEWSVAGDTIWVLQTHPTTIECARAFGVDRFDTAATHRDTYSPEGVVEMLPGVLDPLVWSINGRLLENALRSLLRRNGIVVPPVDRSLVGRFHGRAALNLTALGEATSDLGGTGMVEREYLGAAPDDPGSPRPRPSVRGLIRAWRERRLIEDEVATVVTAVACLPLLGIEPATLDASTLIAYRRELRDLAARGYLAEASASAAATTAFRSLEAVLGRWLGPEAGTRQAQDVITGGPADLSVGGRRIAALSRILDEPRIPGVRALLAGASPAEARTRLAGIGAEGTALVTAVESAGRAFGSIAVYGGPTFDEAPDELWRLAAAAAAARPVQGRAVRDAVDQAIGQRASGRRWRVTRLLTGQFIDVRRRILYRLAADAAHLLGLREEAKSALLVLGGMERRVIAAAAARLVRSGHLDEMSVIELLDDSELDQMLVGGEPVGRLTLERRRADAAHARTLGPLPAAFVGTPQRRQVHRGSEGRLLGWAASPGRATARARHLRGVADGDLLEAGEIIVAVATDPSWTPLFHRCGGIVLEQGGPLSHAAIVARELGLPAVLNVAGAMESIPPGATVTVDGTAGVVTRVMAAVREEVSA